MLLPGFSAAADACEQDRSCCTSPGLGIDKLCWRNDKVDWSRLSEYKIANHFENDNGSRMVMFQHYHSGDFQCEKENDFTNSKSHCGVFRYVDFRPAGWYIAGGSVKSLRWTPVKLMGAGECWSCGSAGVYWETEQYMDKHSVVNNYWLKFVKQGEIVLSSQGIPSNAAWSTAIAGKYPGIRYTFTSGSDTFEFVHALSIAPSWYNKTSSSEWKATYLGNASQLLNLINVKALVKINGVSTGTEEQIPAWLEQYPNKAASIDQEYVSFMKNFKYPVGRSDEEVQDYYNVLYNYWYDTWTDPKPDAKSNFYVNSRNAEVFSPNILQYKDGQWVWDSAISLMGMLPALESNPDTYVVSKVKDAIAVEAKNQPKYPAVSEWSLEIHPAWKGNGGQPAELYLPVTLYAYKKGLISKTELCDIAPNFKSAYMAYKAKAGSDFLLSFGPHYGRDGTDALQETDASADASGGFAMMALGLNALSEECGLPDSYDADYAAIKTNFEKLWNPGLGLYVNLDKSGNQVSSQSAMKATPYGECMAIIAGIVPKDRYQKIFDAMDTYFVHNNIGYTSIANTHSCFTAAGVNNACLDGETWDGPIWSWADNAFCLQAIRVAKDRDGIDISQKQKIESWSFKLMGSDSPFAKESYNPASLSSDAEWDSVPYAPAGNEIPGIIFSFNPYAAFDDLSPPSQPSCIPVTEKCDGKDNDCDLQIDEGCLCLDGETKSCGSSSVGECRLGSSDCVDGDWTACSGNIEPTIEMLDQKDNDCDGAIDDGLDSIPANVSSQPTCDPSDLSLYETKSLNWMLNFLKTIIDYVIAKFAPG
ncbi:MAG: hypothetical protein HGA85_04205 [Nanoarchaeota archaeon]|nr:hypothetical protein [Nanoarchaeota archaeon]